MGAPVSPNPNDPHEAESCPICEAELALVCIEADLRTLSLDLGIAGWTPDELLDHVRRSVANTRAVDLVALAVQVDDSHRSEQSRPPAWRRAVERLQAATGTTVDDLRPGWIGRWLRANSTYETSQEAAELLHDVGVTLTDLVCPQVSPSCPS